MESQARMQPITPYLTVKGAAEAIALYQKAFGAKENTRMPAQDGKRLMHADLTINGGTVMLSDEFPEACEHSVLAPSVDKPAGVAVSITYRTPAEVDATFRRAVEAGCKGTLQPQDMFFGMRFATLDDPFGHRWMLAAPLPQTRA
jgi:PhnB protein